MVDDEIAVCRTIKMMLEHVGHHVAQADSGDMALEHLSHRHFDLIITGFSMPGMHGDQLVTHIRRLLPAQPIIMATAYAEEYKLFHQPGGDVDALLLKPFTFKELLDAIEDVMTHRQLDQPSVSLPDSGQPRPPDFHPPPRPQ